MGKTIVIGIITGVICGSACGSHGWRLALQEYEQGLRLTIKGPSVVSATDRVDFEFQIQNRGGRTLEACLGPSRQISLLSDARRALDGRPPVQGSATLVDHPGCERRFKLESGEQFYWTEAIAIPNVAAGPGQLTINVQIVSPRHCDRYGCYNTMLRADTPVSVR